MSEMLKALGVTANQKKDYNTQFGITLNKRTSVEIEPAGGKKLLAETAVEVAPWVEGALLEQLQTDFDIQPGETDMLIMDMPDMPPQQTPIIYVQKGQTRTNELDGSVGVCFLAPTVKTENDVRNDPDLFDLAPREFADNLYARGPGSDPRLILDYKNAKLTVLQAPKHGTVSKDMSPGKDILYYPDPGFLGNDKVIFLVDIEGHKVKVVYFVKVLPEDKFTNSNLESTFHKYCPSQNPLENSRTWWKISLNPAPDYTQDIQPLLTYTGISNSITLNIADLPNSTLAQTTSSSITLDPTAAGHNWYIDYTPYLNEEYLPTSNPNEWIAKAGSEAAGKMDLLSVLLHEYGHVLGIEHSANPGDYMAATLAPGVRRLPSSDELALMAQLVAETRLSQDGAPTSPDPTQPTDPSLPLGALGFALLGRLRRTDFGTLAAESSATPHYQVAINPTLENAALANTTAWSASGNVALPGDGSAILGESATAQSRLAQGFVINPGDRSLSFTVDADLAANGGTGTGPGDAFEVALLDANSGAALVGSDGLALSDALLNLQTDGAEHSAASVRKVRNADGSTTYHVGLEQALRQGDPVAGTPALLSFNLIGFGGEQSHVTLRDIRLSRDPLALDDSVILDEDSPVILAPLANDLIQTGETPVLEIATWPTHGVLAPNWPGAHNRLTSA